MSGADWLQLFGSTAMTAFAGLLLHIAKNGGRFSRYGREALLCSACFVLSIVAVRMLALVDILSQMDARTINGLGTFIWLAILAQAVYLRQVERRVNGG